MKLSTKGRYAGMAMADLASNTVGDPISLAEIARRQEISLSYLEQLFGKLRRGEVVKSVRGPGGGYLLSRTPSHVRISDIILAVDEHIKATRCNSESSLGCTGTKSRCLTHDLWAELGNQIYLLRSSIPPPAVCVRRVPPSRVRLARGATSRDKLFEIDDLSEDELMRRLSAPML